MRIVVTALVLISLGAVGAATAAPASHSARADNFCSVSKGVASQLVGITNVTATSSGSKLKAEYAAIKAAEPALKSSAPRKLKPNVVKVLAFADTLGGDLAAVNWNLVGLLPKMTSLTAQAAKATAAFNALRKYYTGTCHFSVG